MMATTLPKACMFTGELSALPSVVKPNLLRRLDHVIHILIAHAMKHGQADETLASSFRHREFAATITKTFAVIRMKTDGNIVHVYADVLSAQRTENFVATCAQFLRIHFYRIQMPGRQGFLPHPRHCDSPDPF